MELPTAQYTAGISATNRARLERLHRSSRGLVTVAEAASVLKLSRFEAAHLLAHWNARGWVRRARRGLYVLVPMGAAGRVGVVADPWVLLAQVFAPCYIGGWSACEHWDLTEQIFNGISVVSAHPQRSAEQAIAGIEFRVRTIDQARVFGTDRVWFGSRRVEVADPHRLLIDILDMPSFGGGARHTLDVVGAYWKSPHRNPAKLLEYAQRYKRGTVFKRMGLTAELFGSVSDEWLEECRKHMSNGISRLDPSGPDTGRILTRWRLRINVPLPGQQ